MFQVNNVNMDLYEYAILMFKNTTEEPSYN